MRMGVRAVDVVWVSAGQIDRAIYMESIILSKHNRAEIRWVRWKANPKQLRVKEE